MFQGVLLTVVGSKAFDSFCDFWVGDWLQNWLDSLEMGFTNDLIMGKLSIAYITISCMYIIEYLFDFEV